MSTEVIPDHILTMAANDAAMIHPLLCCGAARFPVTFFNLSRRHLCPLPT